MEQCVGEDKVMDGTQLEKQELSCCCWTHQCHVFQQSPGLVVWPCSSVEVPKDENLVRLRDCCNEGVKFFIELILGVLWDGHCRGICTDQCYAFLVSEWELE